MQGPVGCGVLPAAPRTQGRSPAASPSFFWYTGCPSTISGSRSRSGGSACGSPNSPADLALSACRASSAARACASASRCSSTRVAGHQGRRSCPSCPTTPVSGMCCASSRLSSSTW